MDVRISFPHRYLFLVLPRIIVIEYFVVALSVQLGYARANGVNFLVSGYDNPSKRNGGSGIYSSNGTIIENFLPYSSQSKLIIADVEKINKRTPPEYSFTPTPVSKV